MPKSRNTRKNGQKHKKSISEFIRKRKHRSLMQFHKYMKQQKADIAAHQAQLEADKALENKEEE